jgi:hypothetical protein
MPIADAVSSVLSIFLLVPELRRFKRLASGNVPAAAAVK